MIKIERVYTIDFNVVYHLARACKHANDDLSVLLGNCLNDPESWAMLKATENELVKGAALCFMQRPDLVLWLLGADKFFNWFSPEVEEQFFRWVKSVGCNYVKCYGRLGWRRKLPEGWKPSRIEFGKAV